MTHLFELVAARTAARPSRSCAPRVPNAHLFDGVSGPALLSVADGRIHEIDAGLAGSFDLCMAAGDGERLGTLMTVFGLGETARAPDPPPASVAVRTFSLAVSQKCNLGCTYCYAEQGSFGGDAKNMPQPIAEAAIDRLFDGVEPGQRLDLVFLGGEPLANREGLRNAVHYAAARASAEGVGIGFSLTTNATLLTAADADFFARYGFSVTISIDGIGAAHDRLRPFKSGRGSFDRVMERARLLLARKEMMRISARVTVTPDNLALPDTLNALVELGFDRVQFSPMLSAPSGRGQMDAAALDAMLQQMIDCGRAFEARLAEGQVLPFANMISTLQRIHTGARDAYPCAAGGSYMGVSADGGLYACHRFVGDEAGAMGDIRSGIDRDKQAGWLAARHLESQTPCTTCWARHLCGGSCHYEAMHAGREACDYIRGWLHYCLSAYVRLLKNPPERVRRVLG